MGIFGGIGKAVKGINWDRLATGLSAAGASAHGDHGTAAQIWGQYGKQRADRRQTEAEAQQRAQLEAAATQMGVPPEQARSLPTSALAGLVSQQYTPRAPSEFDRALQHGGIDPNSEQGKTLYRQRAATMASPAPQMIGSPERGYEWRTPPPPQIPGLTGAPEQQAQQQAPFTFEHFRGARSTLGPQGAAEWVQRNGVKVTVRSPQEAQELPPGTRYTTPDGREFVR